jgi:hypothetical protein
MPNQITRGGVITRGKTHEEKLAEMMGKTVEEVFQMIPIPDDVQKLAARIKKKKALGIDASEEESIRKARLIGIEIRKIQEHLDSEPALLPEQLEKLVSLTKGVLNELDKQDAA